MTKGEATMAGNEANPAPAATNEYSAGAHPALHGGEPAASSEQEAQVASSQQLSAMAAAAAAAAGEAQSPVEAQASAEAPADGNEVVVELASAVEAPAPAHVDAHEDVVKKEGDDDADEDTSSAPVDLALAPQGDIFATIAAADGARAVPGAAGEASLLANEDGRGIGAFPILLGVGIAGGALAIALSDDKQDADAPPPPPANQAPNVTSAATATVDENVAAGSTVYDADATDPEGDTITFSLSGADAGAFTINASTGVVTINASPDFETKPSYTFNVVATDSKGAADTQAVTLTVADVNEAPSFTSTGPVAVDENTAVGDVVYQAVVTDPEDDDVTFSLTGDDAGAFTIDSATGEVRFVTSPDFETQASYDVTVVATDADGNQATQDLTIDINDVDEAPVFGNSTTDFTADENVPAGTVVLDPSVTDPEGDAVTVTLGGDDAAAFQIDPQTGEVQFAVSPDFETQDSYSFTLTATDAGGNETTQTYTVEINDLPEGPTQIDLDASDNDNNPNTPVTLDAGSDDFLFSDSGDLPSYTILQNVTADDQIELSGSFSFSTAPGDPNDLQVIFNNGGVVSEIIVDNVIPNGAGLIYNEATAEAAIGFDLFNIA